MQFSDRLATDNALTLVRSSARLVFGALTFLYLYQHPASSLGGLLVLMVVAGFFTLHGLLVWRGGWLAEFGGLLVDLLAVAAAVWLDPASMPPTLLLFLVILLSGGLLHGPARFNLLLALSALTLLLLIGLGERRLDGDSTAMLFAMTIMLACALYAGVLLYRNQAHERLAREAAWRDPETGLISHQALISTAGWLLPLHDRMALSVTLALVRSDPQRLPDTAEALARRLRRSDVAARYDDTTLAVILPCTTQTAAENLFGDLRQDHEDFRVALITLSDSEQSLEATLHHLKQQLTRAHGSHWLVHAPQGNDH